MLYAVGVIVFALGLLLSIALHEVGHMVPAKRFGVKVTQYMVGFGPTLWSRKRGDTEYGLKAIPLGGYIRMIGMVPPRADGATSRWPRRMATAIEDFRQVSRAEVGPGDQDREFYRLTPGKKIIVMLGGPSMNFVIFLVLMTGLLLGVGRVHDNPTTTVSSVSKCVVPATATAQQIKDCTATNSPAALAGLQAGDRIVSVDGTAITNWDQLVGLIEPAAGKRLSIVVERNGSTLTLTAVPVRNLKYVNDTSTQTKEAGFLGIGPTYHHYYTRFAVSAVPGEIGRELGRGLSALGRYPEKIGSVWNTVFNGKPRDPQGAIGVVGIGRIGGQIAETNQFSLEDKVVTLVSLLASVNLLLFFFNLLPLLPLDGGHVAGALVEAAKRGRARLRARRTGSDAPRKAIYVDTAQMLPVMYGVASVLIVLTLLVLYADIVKPVQLSG